jgi:hypothetical protein
MNLASYWQTYYDFSGKASDVGRSLAFAGIAVVWVFKTGSVAQVPPRGLLLPLALFAVALLLDLLHYVVAAFIWGIFSRYKEKRLPEDKREEDFDAPPALNYPASVLFILKLLVLVVGYLFLIDYLLSLWLSAPAVVTPPGE